MNSEIKRLKRLLLEGVQIVNQFKRVVAATALVLIGVCSVFAQDALSGKYQGTAKVTGAEEAQLTLELKNEGGKVSGQLFTGGNTIAITEGTFTEGKLTLKLGEVSKNGVLNATLDGDKLTGDWINGATKKSVELKKAPATTVAATTTAAPVNLSGQWDAVADANGQNVPFLLTLKVEGEKVTGGSTSQLGDSTITSGSWKDGKLAFQLEGQSGVISMSATVVEGKLTGEFDFSGQLQGRWVAVKKN